MLILYYIGREEFVGKSVWEVLKAKNYASFTIELIKEIQICGDRGSVEGYAVSKKYVIRTGDAAIAFVF